VEVLDDSAPPQRRASDTTLLVERCRDELGDWRVILHFLRLEGEKGKRGDGQVRRSF